MANLLIQKNINTNLNKERKILDDFLKEFVSWPGFLLDCLNKHGNSPAIFDENNGISFNYNDVVTKIYAFASSLQVLGIQKGDFISLFSENNGLHFICHQAIMLAGACSVLRGTSSTIDELNYILNHCEAKALVISDFKALNKLADIINNNQNLKFIVVMTNKDKHHDNINKPCYTFDEFLEIGKTHEFSHVTFNINDNALMMYTSGTTAFPKGVLLSHKNMLSQMIPISEALDLRAGDKSLQILPVWHAYEMTTQALFLAKGLYLHFTTLPKLKDDMKKYNVDLLTSVPRVWEAIRLGTYQQLKKKSKIAYKIFDFAIKMSVWYKVHKMYSEQRITNKKSKYNLFFNLYHKFIRTFIKPIHLFFIKNLYKKIKDACGLNFRYSLSGGGSLSLKDELFYDAMGIDLRIGYGLTETSPVLTVRHVHDKNFLGSVGKPILGTEIKIVDPTEGFELGVFQKGLILARGPQIMKGYYKDEEATRKVLNEDGWFNTGDLGWLTYDNHLVIVGRIKETIVLSNGENIEPVPIEEACLQSNYIQQIVLVGQDEPSIGALIVPTPEALEKCGLAAKELNKGTNLTIKNPDLKILIKKEIDSYIKSKPNLKPFEKIKNFEILKDGMNQENGLLSQTGKMKRNKIFDKYQDLINKMFKDSKT